MLTCHFGQTHVRTNDDTAEIRGEASESIDGGLQIFLVATQIHDGDDLGAVLNDLLPILVFVLVESLGDNLLSFLIEPHDLLSN